MPQVIEIKNNRSEPVGFIRFEESGEHLGCRRTATGFHITIPAYISLKLVPKDEPVPMISGLQGYIFAANSSGTTVDIGQVHDEQWHKSSHWLEKPGGETTKQMNLSWRGTFADLAVCEKVREGRSPQLQIQLRGELSYIISPARGDYGYRSEPKMFYEGVVISYPQEVWVSRLRYIGIFENVLVEVPLPGSPSGLWDEVWQCLITARDAFEQGGTAGWKTCVAEVRTGLERWNRIERVDTGPTDLKERNKQERLDQMRTDLYSLSNYWLHNPADRCSRDDAVLVLSTFSALLAERNP